MVQPPAQIGSSFRIEATQPVQIACLTKYLVTTPDWKTPLGCGATDLAIVGDHVVAAILAHAGEMWVWCGLEMAQDDFGGQFGIGVTEKEAIHRGFGQHGAWRLYLHTIPGMGDDPHRRACDHAQGFQVVDETTTPTLRPITGELRRIAPELFVICSLGCFDMSDLLYTI